VRSHTPMPSDVTVTPGLSEKGIGVHSSTDFP
jgi:hypothetical protein